MAYTGVECPHPPSQVEWMSFRVGDRDRGHEGSNCQLGLHGQEESHRVVVYGDVRIPHTAHGQVDNMYPILSPDDRGTRGGGGGDEEGFKFSFFLFSTSEFFWWSFIMVDVELIV